MRRDDTKAPGPGAGNPRDAAPAAAGVAPGKATLTSHLPGYGDQPVQARGELGGDDAHGVAARGVQGSGQSLPHMDTLQRVFGRHDLSGISAHVGGPAREACTTMGATAYATGNQVAFSSAPDLHTTAHEAAHVVQQRAGVQLKDALGRPGDAYERHADAVADAAVAGRSAEALLDQTPSGGGGTAIQRKEAGSGAAAPTAGTGDGRIAYAAAQLQTMLRQSGLPEQEIERMALAAGMTSEEIAALRAGSALVMTPAQEASLRASLAAAYARVPGRGGGGAQDASASICGSSGNPTPTAQHVPAVTGTRTDATETAAGTTAHTGSVGGGTVTLRQDVRVDVDGAARPPAFAVSYQGPDSQNAHWLQFIWREIIQKDGSNNVTAMTGPITSNVGTYDLTTGGTLTTPGAPAQSNFNTDSLSTTDPFYEAGALANRTADATTMYDHPSSANTFVQRAFANGATEVTSRAHFNTFLVQTDHVTYRTQTNVEWHFTSAAATPAPAFSTGSNGAATALSPDALRDRFRAQFPAFSFIP